MTYATPSLHIGNHTKVNVMKLRKITGFESFHCFVIRLVAWTPFQVGARHYNEGLSRHFTKN